MILQLSLDDCLQATETAIEKATGVLRGTAVQLTASVSMPHLSIEDVRVATETAIDHAEIGAGAIWMAEAMETIKQVALTQPELCVNDIWQAGLSEPGCSRAIGAAMVQARKAGMIVATDRRQPSLQTHMSPVRVWKSLIYLGGEYESH